MVSDRASDSLTLLVSFGACGLAGCLIVALFLGTPWRSATIVILALAAAFALFLTACAVAYAGSFADSAGVRRFSRVFMTLGAAGIAAELLILTAAFPFFG